MALVIKKKISLDFLGKDYQEAYLTFRTIPVVQLEEVQAKMPKQDDEATGESIKTILEILKKYFINGKCPDENDLITDVTAEDLDNLDSRTLIKTFEGLTQVDANLENA